MARARAVDARCGAMRGRSRRRDRSLARSLNTTAMRSLVRSRARSSERASERASKRAGDARTARQRVRGRRGDEHNLQQRDGEPRVRADGRLRERDGGHGGERAERDVLAEARVVDDRADERHDARRGERGGRREVRVDVLGAHAVNLVVVVASHHRHTIVASVGSRVERVDGRAHTSPRGVREVRMLSSSELASMRRCAVLRPRSPPPNLVAVAKVGRPAIVALVVELGVVEEEVAAARLARRELAQGGGRHGSWFEREVVVKSAPPARDGRDPFQSSPEGRLREKSATISFRVASGCFGESEGGRTVLRLCERRVVAKSHTRVHLDQRGGEPD